MYQVQRQNRIRETLQLLDADGQAAETIQVDLNVDEIANRIGKAYETIGMLQTKLAEDPHDPATQEAFGQAVIATIQIIFGDDGTKKILDFYEKSYTEMLLDLFPFIDGEIMPKVREASAKRRDQLAALTKKRGSRSGLFR